MDTSLGLRTSANRKKRKATTEMDPKDGQAQDYIKQAVFTTAVQLIAWGFFSICVLCYHVLLKAYMRPVFWALVLSIPLHSWKANMVRTTRETLVSLSAVQCNVETLNETKDTSTDAVFCVSSVIKVDL